jgi:hypothetical protein
LTATLDFFDATVCKNPCDPGYYGDDTTFVCEECDPKCELCNGGLASECTYCSPTNFMLGSTCDSAAQCVNGYWADTSSRKC